jgi:hypothetical protein
MGMAMRIRDLLGEVRYHDPHGCPAWMMMEPLDDHLLPPGTWLVHFTDHADAIAAHGFQVGVEDLNTLHLTRHNDVFGNITRRTSTEPGYNFAYLAHKGGLDRRKDGSTLTIAKRLPSTSNSPMAGSCCGPSPCKYQPMPEDGDLRRRRRSRTSLTSRSRPSVIAQAEMTYRSDWYLAVGP